MNVIDAIKRNIDVKLDDATKDKISNNMKKLIELNYVSFDKDYKDYIKQFLLTLFRSFNIFTQLRLNIDLDIIKNNKVDDVDNPIIKIININRILISRDKININEIIDVETEDFDRIEVLTY